MTPDKIDFISLAQLRLDKENPRLPLSFRQPDRTEKSIVNWLLDDASIIELMMAIGQSGFFVGESLLVIENKQDTGTYTVVEGNRRLASLLLLQDSSLADVHKIKISKVLEETANRPDKIPCIIFEDRSDILQYLGYRHVTGVKSWSLTAKARYLHSLLPTLEESSPTERYRELAKKIGSRSDYVKKMLVSHEIYSEIEDKNFYKIPKLDETTFHFNYISDSLSKENIRSFIGVNLDEEEPLKDLNKKNLKELIDWFFRKNEQNKSLVLGDSKQLKELNDVLSNQYALSHFRETGKLKESLKYVFQSSDTFHNAIQESLQSLKVAQSYIHNIETHNVSDIEVLKEINNLCRVMRTAILSKDDDWD